MRILQYWYEPLLIKDNAFLAEDTWVSSTEILIKDNASLTEDTWVSSTEILIKDNASLAEDTWLSSTEIRHIVWLCETYI